MPEFVIILVGVKRDGNIGAAARAMKNFGFRELVLVNHPEIGDDAYKRAVHADDVLKNALHVKKLDSALKNLDLVVGTSGKVNFGEKNFLRLPLAPRQFAESIMDSKGRVGLLFGREDFGLLNSELKKCDMVVQIPNSPAYHSMNVSHAVAVVLYELFITSYRGRKLRKLTGVEKQKFFGFFDRVVDATNLTAQKKEKAKLMFRRCMLRAVPTEHEFSILMGVFSKTLRQLGQKGSR